VAVSTGKAQRIAIWVITIVLTVGTIGSFFVIILANQNQASDTKTNQQLYEEYVKQQQASAVENAKNTEALTGYNASKFDASSVSQLKVEVLAQGDGKDISKTDKINVSYFGWLPDGTIFDSSKKKSASDAPISFSLDKVIPGWTEGITGQKVGSTLRLTIPSAQAYGATGSGMIPADTPLQFIVTIHSIE
jgi:FKBP-type peptidyl-prolyl cis-trans isomerase